MSRTINVRAPAAAAVFTDARRRRLLLTFVGVEQSLAEAAEGTGLAMGYVHYHTRRWVALGLLEVSRERPRAGRPVKVYRATGDAFFVADKYLARSAAAGLSAELGRGLEQSRANDDGAGLLFAVESGTPRMTRIEGKSRHPATELWRIVGLDDAAAAALIAQLEDLAGGLEKPAGKARQYLLHMALAPRPVD